jgi:transposase
MIRIDAIWLATEPIEMRAGIDTILARVVKVFGAARPHHAYLFANRQAPLKLRFCSMELARALIVRSP